MTASPAAQLRHDVRTRVNHIVGYGEMLLEDAEATGEVERAATLGRILGAARDIAVLIDRPAAVRSRPEAAGSPRRVDGTAQPLGGRVLIVDDDPLNRELLARMVEREGCAVEHASGGVEALARLEAGGFDLVLLDVLMPVMNGEEVLRRLKGDPRHADLPVLMVSALDEQEAVVRCIEAGAEDYLPKDVAPPLLRARLGACLRKKRARDEERAYLRDVQALTAGAAALQAGAFEAASIDGAIHRPDALGTLARVFVTMAGEVRARELRLAAQVAELRIEIDEAMKARSVAAIVDTDHFHDLQRRAAELRR